MRNKNRNIQGRSQNVIKVIFDSIRAQRGLPVGFLLLRYSVLFTVESLFLLYLLVIS